MDGRSDLDSCADALASAVDDAVPRWVEAAVARLATAYHGSVGPDVAAAATEAGRRARAEVCVEVRSLLAQDVDEQRANPLAVLRRAVAYPTEVLRAAGVPQVVRPEFEERAFPDDDYGLTPATWRDIDESLHEPGLVWGAAKAHAVLARRRAEGVR